MDSLPCKSRTWSSKPQGLGLTLNFLSAGSFVDLNQSGLVLSPGQNTASLPHSGYPSPARAELSVPSAVHGDYSFVLTVFGFLESNYSASTTTPSNGTPSNPPPPKEPSALSLQAPTLLLAIPIGLAALIVGTLAIRRIRARRSTYSSNKS